MQNHWQSRRRKIHPRSFFLQLTCATPWQTSACQKSGVCQLCLISQRTWEALDLPLPPAQLHSLSSQLAAGTCGPENYTDYFVAWYTEQSVIKAGRYTDTSLALHICITEMDRSFRGSVTPQLLWH